MGVEVYLYSFTTTALEGGEGSAYAPAALYPRERPGAHCTEGWVGPQGQIGQVRKISTPPGFDPGNVQPVASRYTDYAALPT